MNKITYAGTYDEGTGKGLTVIIPEERGELVSGGESRIFDGKSAIVLPQFCEYAFKTPLKSCVKVTVESAFYPVKAACVIGGTAGETVRLAAKQAQKFTDGGKGNERVLCALADLISACLSLCAGENLSPVTRQLTAEMDAHISDIFFSLSDCIKKIPLNYDYVRKTFKRETGLTPHGYLVKKRMELAGEIIASRAANRYSNYSVAQISEACGFSEPLYFSRVFKKYYGISPSEYANNL